MKEAEPKLSILLPVRNEGMNIEVMLRVLNALLRIPYEILVIYDTDDDDTIPAVHQVEKEFPHVRLVYNERGIGVINALKTGIDRSKGEYLLIFAADELGPVVSIEEMLQLMDEGCDLVSCTRYAHGGRRLGGSIVGGVLSRAGNRAFRLLSGSALTDATTGIKMFRKSILDRIELESAPVGWAVVFELAIKAQAEGCILGEVPIVSVDRLYGGQSTFRPGPWLKEYLRWFYYGIRRLHIGKSRPTVRVMVSKSTAV